MNTAPDAVMIQKRFSLQISEIFGPFSKRQVHNLFLCIGLHEHKTLFSWLQ